MKITPINDKVETEGVPYVYRGVKLTVARAGNTEFKKVFREVMKPYNDDIDEGRMSEEKSTELMNECLARSILVGWETFTDMDGVEQEYSVEAAKQLLKDDKDCRDAVMKFSSDIDNYLNKSEEDLKVK